jgi:hypothetical protein
MASKLEMQSSYNSPPIRPPMYQDPVQQYRNANSVQMTAELFEKLFLSQQRLPQNDAAPAPADWRKSLGNPTPM